MGIDASMEMQTPKPLTQKELKQLRYELVAAFGADHFFITNKFGIYHAIDEKSNRIYEIRLATRYYGDGYERGDAVTIIAIAQYLELKVPGCKIFYGGDDHLEPFDSIAQLALWQHFVKWGHAPYRQNHQLDSMDDKYPLTCDFCERVMTQHGWGPDYACFYCDGCGRETERKGSIIRDTVEVGGRKVQ